MGILDQDSGTKRELMGDRDHIAMKHLNEETREYGINKNNDDGFKALQLAERHVPDVFSDARCPGLSSARRRWWTKPYESFA